MLIPNSTQMTDKSTIITNEQSDKESEQRESPEGCHEWEHCVVAAVFVCLVSTAPARTHTRIRTNAVSTLSCEQNESRLEDNSGSQPTNSGNHLGVAKGCVV